MKYVKKDEFKNTRHCFRGEFGDEIILVGDITKNKYVYDKNKFMFDILIEEEVVEIVKEKVVIPEKVAEPIVEKVIREEVVDEEVDELNDPIELVLEELDECSTVEQIYVLATENNLDLDGRIRNIKKLKDNFKEELEMKV